MKNFEAWSSVKSNIGNMGKVKVFHKSEIWWCCVGLNIGDEEDGKNSNYERPVYVYRKFNNNIFLGIPLTSKYKDNEYHFKINENENSTLLLSQVKLMSSKRLLRYIKKITENKHKIIKDRLVNIL